MKDKLLKFFEIVDENGISNLEKVKENQKIIRRVDSTDKNKSYEESKDDIFSNGIVIENDKLIGFGIHIFNEDVYPLQSFEIYLRNCNLVGDLDISDCDDMVFLDVYHNKITSIATNSMASMRILGIQDNCIKEIDVSGMPVCQGIDAGMNELSALDVSNNKELVELYINDNHFTSIDLSQNEKLKYFYCHNNQISELDTTNNPLLRHLNASGNPMKAIKSLAPQREQKLPLELYASEGGYVGLKYYPVYNAQWKETGEWKQSYHAYPEENCKFVGWFDETGEIVSDEAEWIDEYGTSRILKARFAGIDHAGELK